MTRKEFKPKEFIKKLKELCDEHGLIINRQIELKSGISRRSVTDIESKSFAIVHTPMSFTLDLMCDVISYEEIDPAFDRKLTFKLNPPLGFK